MPAPFNWTKRVTIVFFFLPTGTPSSQPSHDWTQAEVSGERLGSWPTQRMALVTCSAPSASATAYTPLALAHTRHASMARMVLLGVHLCPVLVVAVGNGVEVHIASSRLPNTSRRLPLAHRGDLRSCAHNAQTRKTNKVSGLMAHASLRRAAESNVRTCGVVIRILIQIQQVQVRRARSSVVV